MKATIKIADDLFARAQVLARKEKTAFRALTEQGLRLAVQEKLAVGKKLPPLVVVKEGLMDEFKDARGKKSAPKFIKAMARDCGGHQAAGRTDGSGHSGGSRSQPTPLQSRANFLQN